jgi:xylitol oxidase
MTESNWAGNVVYGARRVLVPESVEELQAMVASSPRIRALGTRHSFSRVADTRADLLTLARLPATIVIDGPRRTVTVGAAVRYGDLARRLHSEGWALHNLGSLPHIGVAGACATGTHGSGDANGSLATAVRGLEVVGGDGERRLLTDVRGSAVGLGALGVVTTVTLAIQPSYDLRQVVFEGLTIERVADLVETEIDALFGSAYSVSVFTDWAESTAVWVKGRDAVPVIAGARAADGERHPIPGLPPENCTRQLGIPGAWHERLPHFRLDFTPSSGAELQSEYLVARADAAAAVRAVHSLREEITPLLLISELRTVAADDLWLSPSYGRDSFAIHFTWRPDPTAVEPVLTMIENRLAPLGARPHWGKVFTTPSEVVADLYPRMADFVELRQRLDPGAKFGNDFVDSFVPAPIIGTW